MYFSTQHNVVTTKICSHQPNVRAYAVCCMLNGTRLNLDDVDFQNTSASDSIHIHTDIYFVGE